MIAETLVAQAENVQKAVTLLCEAAGKGDLAAARGMAWARIGELVGQRDLAVTANTYSHVLADQTELDYGVLIDDL